MLWCVQRREANETRWVSVESCVSPSIIGRILMGSIKHNEMYSSAHQAMNIRRFYRNRKPDCSKRIQRTFVIRLSYFRLFKASKIKYFTTLKRIFLIKIKFELFVSRAEKFCGADRYSGRLMSVHMLWTGISGTSHDNSHKLKY